MSSKKYLDKTGLTRVVEKIKALVPSKTSDLTNDSFFVTNNIWTVTLSTANWTGTGAPYTQSININDMLSSYIPQVSLLVSDTVSTAITQQEEYSKISRIDSRNGSVLFTCYEEKPTVDLNVRIEALSYTLVDGNEVSY